MGSGLESGGQGRGPFRPRSTPSPGLVPLSHERSDLLILQFHQVLQPGHLHLQNLDGLLQDCQRLLLFFQQPLRQPRVQVVPGLPGWATASPLERPASCKGLQRWALRLPGGADPILVRRPAGVSPSQTGRGTGSLEEAARPGPERLCPAVPGGSSPASTLSLTAHRMGSTAPGVLTTTFRISSSETLRPSLWKTFLQRQRVQP